jgi:hypothetical protein
MDIGAETVVVATPDRTERHRNAVQAVEETDEVEGSRLGTACGRRDVAAGL